MSARAAPRRMAHTVAGPAGSPQRFAAWRAPFVWPARPTQRLGPLRRPLRARQATRPTSLACRPQALTKEGRSLALALQRSLECVVCFSGVDRGLPGGSDRCHISGADRVSHQRFRPRLRPAVPTACTPAVTTACTPAVPTACARAFSIVGEQILSHAFGFRH